jgi:DNA-binding transcriptional LysR family regulator
MTASGIHCLTHRTIGPYETLLAVVRKLADMGGWTLARPEYLTRHGTPAHPSELGRHSNMIYGHSRDTVTLPFESAHERLKVSLPRRCVANSIELVRQVTLGGLVIGVIPPMLVHDDLAGLFGCCQSGPLGRSFGGSDLTRKPTMFCNIVGLLKLRQ